MVIELQVIERTSGHKLNMDKSSKLKKNANVMTPRKVKAAINGTNTDTYKIMSPSNFNKPKSRALSTPDLYRHSDATNKEIKISVSVRIRPPLSGPKVSGSELGLKKLSHSEILVKSNTNSDSQLVFSYDNVFWYTPNDIGSDQQSLFDTLALPLLDGCIQGYNACLFTYGQTGSGKTYSIMDADGNFSKAGMGIIPRFCYELIQRKNRGDSKMDIKISYYEIYNEKIYDLLHEDRENRINLKVREHPINGPYVTELTVLPVDSFEEVLALIISGNKKRITGTTLANDHSSRSHTIFDISVVISSGVQSKVRLVDLAGSEKVNQCAITEERYKEGLSINKSLLTLGKVIMALSEKKKRQYIPYRDSLLTWLLKDCLGGNSYTCMLATVSPLSSALDETLATLRWASKTQTIVCRVSKNEDPQRQLILELQNEIRRLKKVSTNLSEANKFKPTIEAEELQKIKDLEQQQILIEEKLHSELENLEKRLSLAEKEKTELISQRNAMIAEMCDDAIPAYETKFLDNVKNLLECSLNSSTSDNSVVEESPLFDLKQKYLQKIKHLTLNLKSIYETELSKCNSSNSKLSSDFKIITEIETKVQDIINTNNV